MLQSLAESGPKREQTEHHRGDRRHLMFPERYLQPLFGRGVEQMRRQEFTRWDKVQVAGPEPPADHGANEPEQPSPGEITASDPPRLDATARPLRGKQCEWKQQCHAHGKVDQHGVFKSEKFEHH